MNGFSQALDVPPPTSSLSSSNQQQRQPYDNYQQTTQHPYSDSAQSYSGYGQQQAGLPQQNLEYVILGNEMQLVEFDLSPGQTIVAEAGAMMVRFTLGNYLFF